MESALNSSVLKSGNRRRVLRAIYEHRAISKQELSSKLGMSLPTITKNLSDLTSSGFIKKSGFYESTGGRKAQIYGFVSRARVSLGIVLLKEYFEMIALDMFGDLIGSERVEKPFSRSQKFFEEMGFRINTFISDLELDKSSLLGVYISIQGLVSADGEKVLYGEAMKCTGLELSEIRKYVDYPCSFIHDTEATAVAEIWKRHDIKDAVLLSLARNFSGIFIINGSVCHGMELSGTIEHMRLFPDAQDHLCYCGNCGCIETYCSADALAKDAGETLEDFFLILRSGDKSREEIWERYLKHLAMVINNLRMVIDCEFILSGYLLKFMTSGDFKILAEYADNLCPFDICGVRLTRGAYSENVAAIGAALIQIKTFLNNLFGQA